MKDSILIVTFLVLYSQLGLAQKDSCTTKYEFRSYNGKVKKVKCGKDLIISWQDGDTSKTLIGTLVHKNDSLVTLTDSYYTSNFRSDIESFNYRRNNLDQSIDLRLDKIDIIEWETTMSTIGMVIYGLSTFSLIFGAPIASIDFDAPRNFNVNRYSEIMKYSAIGFGVGLGIYFGFNDSASIRLK